MDFLGFNDKLIPYDIFLNDLSARIVKILKDERKDPEFISQNMAYKMFGRKNIERWRRAGAVKIYRRPGKVEYRTADLRCLQRNPQDYIIE